MTETESVKVKTNRIEADVEIPESHDVKVSSRNFRVVSTSSMNLADGTQIPTWLDEAITEQIRRGTLSLEEALADVTDFVRQLETGINQQITGLQTADESSNELLTTNISRLDNDVAGAIDLIATKVTADEASTISTNILVSQFNTPDSEAEAWFVNQSSTMANAIGSHATQLTALVSSYNGVSAKITSMEYVDIDANGYSLGASKLGTAPDGAITGWEFLDGTNAQSQFKIYADSFSISNGNLTDTPLVPFSIVGNDISFNGSVSVNKLQSSIHLGTFTDLTIPTNPTFEFAGVAYTIKDGDTYSNSDDGLVYVMAGTWVSLQGINGTSGTRGAISAFAVYTSTPTTTQLTATINAIATPDGVIAGDNVTYTISSSGTKMAYYNGTSWVTNVALYVHGDAVIDGTITTDHITTAGLDAEVITSGVIYNTGGSASSYTMKINLDGGEIHIK